jgi:hypothetical protein
MEKGEWRMTGSVDGDCTLARWFSILHFPFSIWPLEPVPEPGEDDGGGFAEAGGDIDEARAAAFWIGLVEPVDLRAAILFAAGEAALVIEGAGMAGGSLEKNVELHAHTTSLPWGWDECCPTSRFPQPFSAGLFRGVALWRARRR